MLLIGSATKSEVGQNAVPRMVESKFQPHLSLHLAVVCVYDPDHLTSSAVSPCSGKTPAFNTVLT